MKTAKVGQPETSPDKRRIVIEALLAGESHEGAAAAAGVSRRTISRWLGESSFADELETARTLAFMDGLGGLKGGMAQAVKALLQNLKARTPAERRQTARTIIELAFRGVEVAEFEKRLSALEKFIEERPGHSSRVS